jgi:uncharacterized protein YxjI
MDAFSGDRFVLKRKLLKLLGSGFVIEDASGNVVLEAKQKAFRLREDIRLRDASGQEVLGIFARHILDFSAAYDVVDLRTDAKLGSLRRKGFHSLVRDTWEVMDAHDRPIGQVVEDSLALGLVRRFATNLVPQSFDLVVGGQKVADLRQNFNPFTYHLSVGFAASAGGTERFDRRLGLAAATLLAVIEGRQKREN